MYPTSECRCRWQDSFDYLRLSVSQSILAHQTSVVSTTCFCARWYSDLACRYSSVCTECPSDPSGLLLFRTSKNGKLPFCSISIVNVMVGWMLFRCCRKPCGSFLPCGHTTDVPSSYLYHHVGFLSPSLYLLLQNAPYRSCVIIEWRTVKDKNGIVLCPNNLIFYPRICLKELWKTKKKLLSV
jgi:hypothetical protein